MSSDERNTVKAEIRSDVSTGEQEVEITLPTMPPGKHELPTSRSLHDRAEASTKTTIAHTLVMSTGVLAVFFIALTGKVDPPLTAWQQVAAFSTILFMAIVAACCVLWTYADGRWAFAYAHCITSSDLCDQGKGNEVLEGGTETHSQRALRFRQVKEANDRIKHASDTMGVFSFVLGSVSAAAYLLLRVGNPLVQF